MTSISSSRINKSRVARVLLGIIAVIFLVSAIAKAIEPTTTILSLSATFSWIPLKLVVLFVCALTAAELILACHLLLRPTSYVLEIASGLLLMFTFYLFYLAVQPFSPPCGCSPLSILTKNEHDNAYLGILRNVVMLLGLAQAYRGLQPPTDVCAANNSGAIPK